MKLLSPAISILARMRLWRIEKWINHPQAAQREVLQELVTAAQYSSFGKKYKQLVWKKIQLHQTV